MRSPLLSFFLVFAIFLVAPFQVFAICLQQADYVAVYPKAGGINRNPVFLIEYNEGDFKLDGKLKDLEFYLLVNKKQKVKVEILQAVTGIGSESQLLLKPTALLRLNDSVQLQVISKTENPNHPDLQFETFKTKVNRKKWLVASAKDLEPVAWTGNITPEYKDMRSTSLGGHRVLFYYQVADSNPVIYEYGEGKRYELHLFEVAVNGQTFFCIGGGPKSYFDIHVSDCGSNFRLQGNKNYEATVTALDFSGNRNPVTRKVRFNTNRQ